jgi:hypothetical protein
MTSTISTSSSFEQQRQNLENLFQADIVYQASNDNSKRLDTTGIIYFDIIQSSLHRWHKAATTFGVSKWRDSDAKDSLHHWDDAIRYLNEARALLGFTNELMIKYQYYLKYDMYVQSLNQDDPQNACDLLEQFVFKTYQWLKVYILATLESLEKDPDYAADMEFCRDLTSLEKAIHLVANSEVAYVHAKQTMFNNHDD